MRYGRAFTPCSLPDCGPDCENSDIKIAKDSSDVCRSDVPEGAAINGEANFYGTRPPVLATRDRRYAAQRTLVAVSKRRSFRLSPVFPGRRFHASYRNTPKHTLHRRGAPVFLGNY